MNNTINKQQGVAIITVLLIVAFITTAITLLLSKQNILLDNTKLMQKQQKALTYFLSAQSMVKYWLLKDKDLNYDGEDEDWHIMVNQRFQTIPVDDVIITNNLVALNSKLNINNFIKIEKNQTSIRSNPNFNTCLNKIANKLEILPINDFVFNYINFDKKKQLITDITELKNIPTINKQDYYKIKDYIFASNELIKININTASAEILECLHYDLGEFNAEEIIKNRPFKTMADAKKELAIQLPHLEQKDIDNYFNNLIDVKTKYFLLQTNINLGEIKFNINAVLKREKNKITTHKREFNYEL